MPARITLAERRYYRTRHAETRLRLLADHAKVVLVVGARQVGKSTLLSQVFSSVPALKRRVDRCGNPHSIP